MLAAALARIERLGVGPIGRRLLRAAACHNHGDTDGWRREMEAGIAAVADQTGHGYHEMDAVVQKASYNLSRRGVTPN